MTKLKNRIKCQFQKRPKWTLPLQTTLTRYTYLTNSLVCYSYSHENPFFHLKHLGFFVPFLSDAPFMGASDTGQESAIFSTLRY